MKKKLIVLSAAALVAAAAVPAMAFENEFHGMYTGLLYSGNFFNGQTNGPATNMKDGTNSGFFAEQRARLQYIGKASDDLKLVTHFELDTRFGSRTNAAYYVNDSGALDADQITLETKNVYLDFNAAGTNFKMGIQPWADSYNSLFALADMTGVYAKKAVGPATLSGGWFRYNDKSAASTQTPGDTTSDFFVVDAKVAPSKDITVGASYYFNKDKSVTTTTTSIHTVGVNANINAGPAAVNPFFAMQFGDTTPNSGMKIKNSGYLGGVVAKVKAGPVGVNVAGVYISGDKVTTDDKQKGWVGLASGSRNVNYFNAANMWLLVRNGAAVNSSTNVTDNDLFVGSRGLYLLTAGVTGDAGKVFFGANAGYGHTAVERSTASGKENGELGTEVNATVGYKVYDNLKVSLNGAYMFLGKGLNSENSWERVGYGAKNADDPWMGNVMVQYTF